MGTVIPFPRRGAASFPRPRPVVCQDCGGLLWVVQEHDCRPLEPLLRRSSPWVWFLAGLWLLLVAGTVFWAGVR